MSQNNIRQSPPSASILKKIWSHLTANREVEENVVRSSSARLLAVLLLTLTVGFIVVDTYKSVVVAGYYVPWYGYGILVATFVINRFVSYRLAAIMTCLMFPLVVFSHIYTNQSQDSLQSINYLVLAIILAAILLNTLEMMAFTFMTLFLIVVLPMSGTFSDLSVNDLVSPLSICFFGAVLAQLLRFHRNAIEQKRMEQVGKSERRFRDLVESIKN